MRVPRESASRFREAVAGVPGDIVFEDGLLLNEEGGSEIELSVVPGRLHLVVAHPTTDSVSVEIVRGLAKVVNVTQVGGRVTRVAVLVEEAGTVVLSLKAGSDAALNPAYVNVKQEATPTPTPAPITVTVTVTTTATVATTYTTTAVTPVTYTTTAYETLTRYETLTIPVTVVAERTVERTTAVTVTTPTTVYYRETEWGTVAGLSAALLVAGIIIGRLIARKR